MDSKVEQFKAITGAPSKLAKSLLEACGGNLELAVNMHMEGGGSSVPPVATQGHSSGSAIEHEPTSNEILSPTSYKAMLVNLLLYVLAMWVMNVILYVLCFTSVVQTWCPCSYPSVQWCVDRGDSAQ